MQKIQFGALPRLVQFGAAAGIFFLWTGFEKQIIEPLGIHRYMPFYRVEGICAWDILAMTVLAATFVVLNKRSSAHTP